jgi:ABC-type polysaccharide/polyol phosphate export permease
MVLKAKESLLGATSIISRVYFPREIIIILVLGETVIDFLFVFAALIVINMTQGIYPNVYYILLPLPILIMTLFSSGLAFLLAWLGLIIRDLQQLLTVLVQLLFYIVVFYAPERVVSDDYAVIINFIPLAPLVTAFRDILLYERMPDLISLYYPLVLGCMLLYFGYVYFKVNEDRFMDFI